MRRPNFLVFMTDHQRADTVLPEHPTITENTGRLGGEGVTFTDAFCPSPHCCPSRATFHTGLYPSRHGVWNNVDNGQALSRGPKRGTPFWSRMLAGAGYRLAFSGKWHVSADRKPGDYGWEELCTFGGRIDDRKVWARYRAAGAGKEPGERGPGEIVRPGYPPYRLYGSPVGGTNDRDEGITAAALKALPALARGGDPWCLYIGVTGPHDAYQAPDDCLRRYRLDEVALPGNYGDRMRDKPTIYQRLRDQVFGQLTAGEAREAIRHYRAHCTFLDGLFGQVLATLERTGQAADTLVLYCADHGDYCGEHGLFCKGIPAFQGAYRVPAVVRWPAGLRSPGRRCEEFVSLADFGPTFLELAGVPFAPEMFTGRSLAPFLRGEPVPGWRQEMHTQCNGVELYYTQRSVQTRDYKYVFNGFDRDELYDLRADPLEMRNLAGDPAVAGVTRAMAGRMWRFAAREGDTAVNSYITVGLAPWGPGEAFRGDETEAGPAGNR